MKTSYELHGHMWHWFNGIMDINMLNVMERFAGKPGREGLVLTEVNRQHWIVLDKNNHRKTDVTFEIWQQDACPAHEENDRTMCEDWRPKDLRAEAVRCSPSVSEIMAEPRKKLPVSISFK